MSKAILNLESAQKHAVKIRPKVAGFPYLAEVLRAAGVRKNIWHLPACESVYYTSEGVVIQQGSPLVIGSVDVPKFDKNALIKALRRDQAGEGSFPEFLTSAWNAGVVRYEVNFLARNVIYYGINDETYTEEYPSVEIR